MPGGPAAAQEIAGPAPLLPGLFAVDADGAPWLLGGRCGHCGEALFPVRSVCPRCKRAEMEELRLGRGARLFSFTVCHAAPAGWRAPYLQAYVELPERLRVFTLISDEVEPRADALEVGMAMELVVEPLSHDPEVVTYKFRPAREDGDA